MSAKHQKNIKMQQNNRTITDESTSLTIFYRAECLFYYFMLPDYFAVKQVLWLDYGIAGDDTDGHIDTIARFISEDTVVAVIEEDPLGVRRYTPPD